MKKPLALAGIALALALSCCGAFAQSSPGLVYGQVPTAAQWNSYFAAKQDVLGYIPVNKAGDVMTGRLVTVASTTSAAGFNIPQGGVPSAPFNGDVWTTSSGMFVRINGVTVGPVSAGALPGGTSGQVQTNNGAGGFSGITGTQLTALTGTVVVETGADTVSAPNCNARYSLQGAALYTLTIPSASGFPLGCSFDIVNDDPMPTYTSRMFTGTISGTSMTTIGSGPTAVGHMLTGSAGAITAGTTVTACPGGVCGGAGVYTISNSITLATATFTGTAAASPHAKQLTVTSVTGTILIGSTISGTGVNAGTTILRQFSGTPGGAGVYLTSAATAASAASITATPTIGSYSTGGGRCKFLSGLTVTKLCPGQGIHVTSLGGAGWAQPPTAPRWNMVQSNIRFFISPTGSDTTGDGLGGCGGSPFATLQGTTNYLGRDFDLRNIDPWTVQFCPATYTAGTQETHFPTDVPGRNGGAGIRITGSPLGLGQCIDSTNAILSSGGGSPVIDGQLPYVWIQPDCMTINATNGPAVSAARGSTVLMSTGLIIGAGGGGGNTQLSSSSAGHLLLDGGTTLIMTGDEASNGFWLNMGGAGFFANLGGDFAWDTGTSTTFNYTNAIIMGQGSDANFGGAQWDVNGTIPATVSIDMGRLWAGNPIPFGGFALTSGACANNGGSSTTCATQSAAWGGTGNTTLTAHGLVVGQGTSATTSTGPCNSNIPVTGTGASTDPQCGGTIQPANGGTGVTTTAGEQARLEQGMTLLSVLTASNSATLSDTTSFTSTYDDYLITFDNIVPVTNQVGFQFQVHSGGSFQTTGYLNAAGGATTYVDMTNASITIFNGAGTGYTSAVKLTNVNSTAVNKWVTPSDRAVWYTAAGTVTAANIGGVWNGGQGIIDGFQVQVSSGNFSGTVKIYGLRRAL